MKKNILFLVLLTFSCHFNDIKFTQDFNDEESEQYVVESSNTISSNNSKNQSKDYRQINNAQDINNKIEKDYNNKLSKTINSYPDEKINDIQQDSFINPRNDYENFVDPEITNQAQTGKNFETNNLFIPPSSHRKIQVALFLPFTGKNKELGWSIFNASSLSLFDNDIKNKIELVLFDSKETPEENQKVFKEIINSNIKVVIGPIFTSTVLAIEKLALDNDITVISLSNNHELLKKTNNYGGIFVGGIIPESQVDKIVNFSMDKGKFNFAIIAPNNQYGKIITEYTKKFVRSRDGNFITSEFYENNNRDIDRAVERVIGSFSVPTNSRNRDTSYLSDYDRIYPQVIFIPEAGKALNRIASSISRLNRDERNFQLIGTTQWNDPSTLNDINLLGAWIPAPEDDRFRIFEKNYYRSFGKLPPRITSIAYDAILAISKISENKSNLKISFADFIEFNNSSSKNSFQGIDGIFRFLPNGAVQRNLAVLQVGNGKFETLESSIPKFINY